jgi:hypothetical protein
LRNFLETDSKHIVKEEGRALEWRQTLQSQHQGQSDIVDLVVFRLDDRLG